MASHQRAVGRYVEVLCLDHYLEVLKTKPGALPGATALAQAKARGVFTQSHQSYWEAARFARGDAKGTRALIAVLLAHRSMPAAALIAAMDRAVTSGCASRPRWHPLTGADRHRHRPVPSPQRCIDQVQPRTQHLDDGGVFVGRPPGWAAALTGRAVMSPPGRPPSAEISSERSGASLPKVLPNEHVALACGVSGPAGSPWFRHAGGMPPVDLAPASGHYLCFSEGHRHEEVPDVVGRFDGRLGGY